MTSNGSLQPERPRILAIDDEPDVLAVLETVLGRSGFEVSSSPNGADGLIKAHVEQPDLILLDIMMEEMDGWETLRLLKLDERSSRIPVIILSARAEPRDKIRALQDGAADYIVKPFSIVDSLERIRTVLHDAARPRGSAMGDRAAAAEPESEAEAP
ncbi:MAG: response regulator [Acidobacteriota bacterium]